MRPIEVLIALVLAVYLLWGLLSTYKPRWVQLLPFAVLLLVIIHLVLEKYRWQMIPLYALTLVASLTSILDLTRPRKDTSHHRGGQITASILGLIALGIAAALPALLPVPELLPPTGPHPVGTLTLALVDPDPNRMELYSQNPHDPREVMVQLWYPAKPEPGNQLAPWVDHMEIFGPAIASWLELPPFFLDHVELARTNSFLEAPIADAPASFPVLLFSHGWGGFRAQNTYQAEELASHGYVIAAVQHTYGAVATVFPDGRLALYNPEALPHDAPLAEKEPAANRLVSQWAGDLGFVLDYIGLLNHNDPAGRFTGRLDLNRVGVFGHSTGGGATIEFCAQDTRCRASLGMDIYMLPVSKEVLERGLEQPTLAMFSQAWPSENNNQLFDQFQSNMVGEMHVLTISGTDHYDFTDLPMFSPLAPALGLKGPLPGPRTLRIIRDYTLAFFDWYLKGKATHLLERDFPEYPEVIFR